MSPTNSSLLPRNWGCKTGLGGWGWAETKLKNETSEILINHDEWLNILNHLKPIVWTLFMCFFTTVWGCAMQKLINNCTSATLEAEIDSFNSRVVTLSDDLMYPIINPIYIQWWMMVTSTPSDHKKTGCPVGCPRYIRPGSAPWDAPGCERARRPLQGQAAPHQTSVGSGRIWAGKGMIPGNMGWIAQPFSEDWCKTQLGKSFRRPNSCQTALQDIASSSHGSKIVDYKYKYQTWFSRQASLDTLVWYHFPTWANLSLPAWCVAPKGQEKKMYCDRIFLGVHVFFFSLFGVPFQRHIFPALLHQLRPPSHGRGLLLLITDVTVQETVPSPRWPAAGLGFLRDNGDDKWE